MAEAGARLTTQTQLAHWIARRFFARFHLSLILAFAFAVGLLTTRGFLALGLDAMHWRWPLALVAAYLAFLLGIRLWLSYVGLGRYIDDTPDLDLPVGDVIESAGSSGGGASIGGGIDLPGLTEAAGHFGGGGASGDFAAAVTEAAPTSSGEGFFSGVELPDLEVPDVDEGIVPLLVVALIAALAAAAIGAGVYLIWQAPAILAESAFEAALAAGLVRAGRRVTDPGWVGGALRASWLPFTLIFLLALGICLLAEHFAPEARTLVEAVHILLN